MKALISVSDKTGVVEFAKGLVALGWEILSTSGTMKLLKESGVPVTSGLREPLSFPRDYREAECDHGGCGGAYRHRRSFYVAQRCEELGVSYCRLQSC